MPKLNKSLFILSLAFSISITAQTKKSGPIITAYGNVFEVKNPDFKVDTTKEYKAVFEIMNSPGEHHKINPTIETAARFLNMHAQSGVPAAQLKFALVIHGNASKDIISNEAYQKRYGTHNPNHGLITALLNAGGKIVFCGQSSVARGIPKNDLMNGVQLSLSAMTALIHLQDKKYRLIKF
ncbi:MAG: DsrE family protein [Maribacter sp.]|nr:DsrE family protein [Maribacter sp.]